MSTVPDDGTSRMDHRGTLCHSMQLIGLCRQAMTRQWNVELWAVRKTDLDASARVELYSNWRSTCTPVQKLRVEADDHETARPSASTIESRSFSL